MDVDLTPSELEELMTIESTIHMVGSLELRHLEDTALRLAKRLAKHGLGDGIRHDLCITVSSSSSSGNNNDREHEVEIDRIVVTDLDALAFVFSEDRTMTLFRHCLTHAYQLMNCKFEMESQKTYTLAKGIFPFVKPYYFFYLHDRLQLLSLDDEVLMRYVDVMMSDAEMNCFAMSTKPEVSNTFVTR